jgi:hypothetical protein
MTGVLMPEEGRLPAGPQRDLTAAIHDLYVAAGKPGTRRISSAIRERDDLPDTVSHEAVRTILGGTRSRWHKVESVVRQLAVWSVDKPDVAATVEKIHTLWLAVDDVSGVEPCIQPADPTVFRQAVRGVHGSTHTDAISTFFRTVLFVPQADSGALVVAATPTEGLWVCVFTGIDRLRTHQRATQPRWAGHWIEIVGCELIRQVSQLRVPVGILVDPAAAAGLDVTETLPLPDHLVAEIARTL